MSDNDRHDQSFRDHIATADSTGKRIWLYPAKPKGKLYNGRKIVAYFLLAFLFVAPFIKFGGRPLILLDLLDRTFIFFGLIFRPADFHLFVLAILTTIVFVVLFTAIFGRLFCGWICPQTIFMEMVFRRIEYFIDGSPAKQKKLDKAPMMGVKLVKRVIKHSIFYIISFIIGNTFLAYIIGIDQLKIIVTSSPSEHLVGFIAMLLFSFVFYFVFSWFREQACTLVCPYGRLQSVLIDPHSIIVAYDPNRGEPRARFRKDLDRTDKGDCIDCRACVMVCPTGIDIRNGTQLECINCTACIDSCNSIMDKIGSPRGLIRYTSEEKLEGKKYKIPGRVFIYSAALIALFSLLAVLVSIRIDVETTIMRTPGTLYYRSDDGMIRNLYTVKLINKTFNNVPVQFRLKESAGGKLTLVGAEIVLKPEEIGESAFFVDIPPGQLFGSSRMLVIEVLYAGELIEEIRTSFIAPGKEDGR